MRDVTRHCPRSRRRRVAGWLGRHWTLVGLLGIVLLLLPQPRVVAAEENEEGGAIPLGNFRLLEPIRDSLGASAWLTTSGYDPRFFSVPTGEAARNVVDWGAYGAAPAAAPSGAPAFAPPVPYRSAAPAFSRNLIVTRQVGLFPLQTEPSIAVDPFDPDHLVLGVIDYNFPSMSSYVSFDGGETWDGPNQVRYFQEDLSAAGDPIVAFDRDGNVYMTSISIGVEEFRLGSIVSQTEISSIVVSKSEDDGETWNDAVSTSRSTIATQSMPDETGRERGTVTIQFLDKPWMAIGPNPSDPSRDTIYITYTQFATTYSLLYADELPFLSNPLTETTIMVIRSEDGGQTWSEPVAVSPTVLQAAGASEPGEEGAAAAAPETGSDQGDRAAAAPAAPDDGAFAAAADSDTPEPTATPAATQGDGDATAAAEPEQQGDDGGDEETQQPQEQPGPTTANETVQGSQPAVMPDGTLVVVYLDTTNDGIQEGLNTIMAVTSTDGGRTLSQPIQAGVFRELHFRPRTSFFRWWGAAFPQLAVGKEGEIYVATTAMPPDKPTDDGDVYLLRSLDKGATWEPPVRLNQDDTDRPQFFPSIAVSPNGVLHAMWGDMRDDPEEVRYNIYYSESKDKGATWGFSNPQIGLNVPDTRVTDFASNSLRGFPGGQFIGDYFSIAAADTDSFLVWADTRLGEYGGPNQQIGFARQQAIAPPQLYLNPPSGTAGRDVTIQGFAFQPDSNITIDVGGITITNLRSDAKGQFTTTVYMPVTGQGPRDVTGTDETGNVATASFYTEVGYDTIAQQLGQLQAALGQQPPGALPAPAPPAAPAATPAPLPSPPAVDETP